MENPDPSIRISRLIARDILGDTDEAEKAILQNWREETPANEKLYQSLICKENLENYKKQRQLLNVKREWTNFEKKTGLYRRISVYGYSAASIAAVFILAFVLFYPGKNVSPDIPDRERTACHIVPGSTKAVLVLSDGRNIDLPEDRAEKMQLDGIEVSNNQVKVKDRKDQTGSTVVRNKIITPRGGEYNLILADGTSVFINSESRLEFPDRFTEGKREVYLEGEAYFSVAKMPDCPFIVKTAQMEVKVTGTEFNLKAYREENLTQTTLVKGEVRVSSEGKSYKLHPSQQAEYDARSGETVVKDVDINPFIAWKNGQFLFKSERLEAIMTTLGRWYDFEVVYTDDSLKNIVFAGKLKRSESIDPILDVIRSTRKINVEIKGKQIIFSKK